MGIGRGKGMVVGRTLAANVIVGCTVHSRNKVYTYGYHPENMIPMILRSAMFRTTRNNFSNSQRGTRESAWSSCVDSLRVRKRTAWPSLRSTARSQNVSSCSWDEKAVYKPVEEIEMHPIHAQASWMCCMDHISRPCVADQKRIVHHRSYPCPPITSQQVSSLKQRG